jgi:hypothetical protein
MNEYIAATAAASIVSILLGLVGLASLVCWILEIVAAFKKGNGPLMGILSIVLCSLGGFIIGWIHAGKWGIKNVMIAWTVLVVIAIIANVGSIAAAG